MLHRRLLVPLAVVPFAVGAVLTGTASAAPASTYLVGVADSAAATPDAPAAAVPVGITGKPAHYTKKTVSTHRTPSSATTCTAKNAGLKFTNNTAAAQSITAGATTLPAIPAHKTAFVCAASSKPFKVTLSLKSNKNAKLVASFR